MDWTTIGLAPPTFTPPIFTATDFRRAICAIQPPEDKKLNEKLFYQGWLIRNLGQGILADGRRRRSSGRMHSWCGMPSRKTLLGNPYEYTGTLATGIVVNSATKISAEIIRVIRDEI